MRSIRIIAVAGAIILGGCAASSGQGPAAPAGESAVAKPQRTAAQIPMDELMDNEKAQAVFKKHAPEIADHPQLSMARGMTLEDVAGYAEAGLTPETVKAIVDDINRL